MTDNCMMIGAADHVPVESDCGNDNSNSSDASTRCASVSTNHSVSAQIESSTEAPNRLDVEILSKLLFHRARTNASLQLIPIVQRELIINALYETAGIMFKPQSCWELLVQPCGNGSRNSISSSASPFSEAIQWTD